MAAVSLQINVAPADLPHARIVLEHQLRAWAGQVDEIVFSLDTRRPPARSRFAAGWDASQGAIRALLDELCATHAAARIVEVDHDPATMTAVARAFLGRDAMPAKDSRGGPFYAYLHGLSVVAHDDVLHMDSDMLFGGGAQDWTRAATGLLDAHPEVLSVSPLAGPPRADGTLRERPEPFGSVPGAHRFASFSSRVFLLRRSRLRDAAGPLDAGLRLPPAKWLKATVQGNPRVAPPEMLVADAMRRAGLCRVDLLGPAPGMWSLHPPYRSPRFLAALAEIVDRVERGDVPDAQRGDYDVNASLFDWDADGWRARLRRLTY